MTSAAAPLTVILARPRGFCAGVVRAVAIVERALALYGPPVYVRHEIVHNARVVADLARRGAIFVEDTSAIPEGAVAIFSAHGVSRAVEEEAAARDLDVIDATCPLVRKVHMHGRRLAEAGYDIVLIGHAGHPEVEGTRGQIPGRVHVVANAAEIADLSVGDSGRVAYVTQTTLGVGETRETIAALERRFPGIVGPDVQDICYATQNRQAAVLALGTRVELILVVGSRNSSNANRLVEIARGAGVPSRLVDDPAVLDAACIAGLSRVGITAGASAPEVLVRETLARLASWRPLDVEEGDGEEEAVSFRLPRRLGANVPIREVAPLAT